MANRVVLVLITLFISIGSILQAQDSQVAAVENLERLQEGVLIVRIPSYQNKLDTLAKRAENPKASREEQDRIQHQWEMVKEESKAEALILQSAFSNHFDFAKVLFMYDRDSDQLLKGAREGFFLGKNLRPSAAVLNTSSFFVLDIGYTDPSNSARTYAFIIKDQGFNPLSPPFPYAQRINTTGLIFDQISGKDTTQKYLKKAVIRLNRKLHRAMNKGAKL